MVGGEGEFHRHVLAILSSHPLQLLRVLDVHRLEEQRRNVRFFFSHKISSKGDCDSWGDLHHLQLHLLHVSRTCLRHLVVFVRLLVSCQKSALQTYRDPAWWMWTYVARSTNRLSLLLSGARKFQLSFLLLRTPVLSRVGRKPSSTNARTLFA